MMSDKIRQHHLDRRAILYVRQSSKTESTRLAKEERTRVELYHHNLNSAGFMSAPLSLEANTLLKSILGFFQMGLYTPWSPTLDL